MVGELPVKEPAYMHSFGLTERWLVLAEFPLVVNPISIPLSGRPYIENYRWKPELGTRFTLIDRNTGEATGPFETDPFFCFHHVNAYEEDGAVVVDACTYENAQIIEDLYLDRLREGKPADRAEMRRFRIDLGSRRGDQRAARRRASSCRGSTTAATTSAPTATPGGSTRSRGGSTGSSRSTRTDRDDHRVERGRLQPRRAGLRGGPGLGRRRTPACCSRSSSTRGSGNSFMLVLDAADLTELARAEAPHHIPYGFHGQFVALNGSREREGVEALGVRPPVGQLEAGLGVDALEPGRRNLVEISVRISSPAPNGTSMSRADTFTTWFASERSRMSTQRFSGSQRATCSKESMSKSASSSRLRTERTFLLNSAVTPFESL